MRERVRGYADAVFEASGSHVAARCGRAPGLLRASGRFHGPGLGDGEPRDACSHQASNNPAAAGPQVVGAGARPCEFRVAERLGPRNLQPIPRASQRLALRAGTGWCCWTKARSGGSAATDRLDGYASAVLSSGARRAAAGRYRGRVVPFHAHRRGQRRAASGPDHRRAACDIRASVVTGLLTRRASQESARMATYAAHAWATARLSRPCSRRLSTW